MVGMLVGGCRLAAVWCDLGLTFPLLNCTLSLHIFSLSYVLFLFTFTLLTLS